MNEELQKQMTELANVRDYRAAQAAHVKALMGLIRKLPEGTSNVEYFACVSGLLDQHVVSAVKCFAIAGAENAEGAREISRVILLGLSEGLQRRAAELEAEGISDDSFNELKAAFN